MRLPGEKGIGVGVACASARCFRICEMNGCCVLFEGPNRLIARGFLLKLGAGCTAQKQNEARGFPT